MLLACPQALARIIRSLCKGRPERRADLREGNLFLLLVGDQDWGAAESSKDQPSPFRTLWVHIGDHNMSPWEPLFLGMRAISDFDVDIVGGALELEEAVLLESLHKEYTSMELFELLDQAWRWRVVLFSLDTPGSLLPSVHAGRATVSLADGGCQHLLWDPAQLLPRQGGRPDFDGWGEVSRLGAGGDNSSDDAPSEAGDAVDFDGIADDGLGEADLEHDMGIEGIPSVAKGGRHTPSGEDDIAELLAFLQDHEEAAAKVPPDAPSDDLGHADAGAMASGPGTASGAGDAGDADGGNETAKAQHVQPNRPPDVLTWDLEHGSIVWYGRKCDFYAYCDDPRHGGRKTCRKVRTSLAGHKPGQGRPLGYLAGWLLLHDAAPDRSAHFNHQKPTLEQRKAGRELLRASAEGRALLEQEAPKHGEDSEPEVFAS